MSLLKCFFGGNSVYFYSMIMSLRLCDYFDSDFFLQNPCTYICPLLVHCGFVDCIAVFFIIYFFECERKEDKLYIGYLFLH